MTPVPVLDPAGLPAGTAELASAIAQTPIKQHVIHEAVVAELAGRRAGTHSTLSRGKVRGGGAKPWRQKGTGRARQGSSRAPHWTGGGIVFGPTPRSYGGKVNRKVRRQAFRASLRAQVERGSAAVMDPTGWDVPSTARALEYLRQGPDGVAEVRPLLIVVEDLDSVEARSFRNIAGVYVLAGSELQTVDVVAARALLVERAVWERLTGEPVEVTAVSPAPTPKPKPSRTAPPEPENVVAPAAEQEPVEEIEAEEESVEEIQADEEPPPEVRADEEPAADIEADEEPAPEVEDDEDGEESR